MRKIQFYSINRTGNFVLEKYFLVGEMKWKVFFFFAHSQNVVSLINVVWVCNKLEKYFDDFFFSFDKIYLRRTFVPVKVGGRFFILTTLQIVFIYFWKTFCVSFQHIRLKDDHANWKSVLRWECLSKRFNNTLLII